MAGKKKKPIQSVQAKPENKYFVWGLAVSFCLCVFLASSFKTGGDDDYFWHLATGRFIAENHYVPDKDVFGFVTQGNDWIPFEWGWDLLSYGLYTLGGYKAVLIMRSVILTVIFLLYFMLMRKFKINSFISIIFLFALLLGSLDRLTPRPHLISYLFIVVLLYLLITFRYVNREKYLKRLYFIPLIFLIWCNFHMGVAVGIAILFIFLISEIITFYFPHYFSKQGNHPLSKPELKKFLIISLVSLAVLLVNPHGFNTYIYAYEHSKLNLLQYISEWKSPFGDKIDYTFVVTIYKVLLFGGLIILVYAVRTKDMVYGLMYIVFAVYSVRAIRFTVDYEIVIMFFLAMSLNYLIINYVNRNKLLNKVIMSNSLKAVLIVFFIYVSFKIQNNEIYHTIDYYRNSGYDLDESELPVQLFDFMKENNIKGTPFNKFETGGYLVWNFPGQKNFIDSRNLNDFIFNEYNVISSAGAGFEKKLDQYGIEYIIYFNPQLFLKPDYLKFGLNNYLFKNNNWKLVFWDDKSLLFLKNIPKYQDLINRYMYKVLIPYDMYYEKEVFEKNIKSNPVIAGNELDRKAKSEPNGFFYRNMATLYSKYLK